MTSRPNPTAKTPGTTQRGPSFSPRRTRADHLRRLRHANTPVPLTDRAAHRTGRSGVGEPQPLGPKHRRGLSAMSGAGAAIPGASTLRDPHWVSSQTPPIPADRWLIRAGVGEGTRPTPRSASAGPHPAIIHRIHLSVRPGTLVPEHKLSRQRACVGNWFKSALGHDSQRPELHLCSKHAARDGQRCWSWTWGFNSPPDTSDSPTSTLTAASRTAVRAGPGGLREPVGDASRPACWLHDSHQALRRCAATAVMAPGSRNVRFHRFI
jgi:hypothetical protein